MDAEAVETRLRWIAANIRRLRIAKAWTQEELAEAAGLETRYVQTLESGRANPSASVLIRIAAALKAELAELFRAGRLAARPVGRPPGRRP